MLHFPALLGAASVYLSLSNSTQRREVATGVNFLPSLRGSYPSLLGRGPDSLKAGQDTPASILEWGYTSG